MQEMEKEQKMKLRVKLDEGAKMPSRAHTTDAGLDIYSPESFVLYVGDSVAIDTGVHIEIPKGYCGMLASKSGLNVRYGITGEGIIDHGYTGSICVKLYNNGNDETFHSFEKGDKLIQLLIVPIETPELELVENVADLYGGETERGDNGFGSSGK